MEISRAGSRVSLAATIAYALLAAVAGAAFGTLPAATETGAELGSKPDGSTRSTLFSSSQPRRDAILPIA